MRCMGGSCIVKGFGVMCWFFGVRVPIAVLCACSDRSVSIVIVVCGSVSLRRCIPCNARVCTASRMKFRCCLPGSCWMSSSLDWRKRANGSVELSLTSSSLASPWRVAHSNDR